jgi:hypothetical protein
MQSSPAQADQFVLDGDENVIEEVDEGEYDCEIFTEQLEELEVFGEVLYEPLINE